MLDLATWRLLVTLIQQFQWNDKDKNSSGVGLREDGKWRQWIMDKSFEKLMWEGIEKQGRG